MEIKRTINRQVYLSFVILMALCCLCIKVMGQKEKDWPKFGKNVVMLPDNKLAKKGGQFGFITGRTGSDLYFVVIAKDMNANNIPKNPLVYMSNSEEYIKLSPDSGRATYITTIKNNGYDIALYSIQSNHEIAMTSFNGFNAEDKEYGIFQNMSEENDRKDFNVVRKQRVIQIEKGNFGEVAKFSADPGLDNRCGFPVTNSRGALAGIIVKDGKNVEVMSMLSIRSILQTEGSKKGSEGSGCLYFTLLRQGEKETPCKALEKKQIAQRQRALKRDEDYGFAMSIGGGMDFNSLRISNSPFKLYTGKHASLTLHINPDDDDSRVAFRPTFSVMNVGPGKGYSGGSDANFNWMNAEIRTLEIPFIADVGVLQFFRGDVYVGYGASYGRQLSAKFTFNDGQQLRTQNIVGNQRSQTKGWLEAGVDYQQARFALYSNYGFNPLLNKNYEVIINGKSVRPFNDMKRHQVFVGFNLSYRLWGRWQNGTGIAL